MVDDVNRMMSKRARKQGNTSRFWDVMQEFSLLLPFLSCMDTARMAFVCKRLLPVLYETRSVGFLVPSFRVHLWSACVQGRLPYLETVEIWLMTTEDVERKTLEIAEMIERCVHLRSFRLFVGGMSLSAKCYGPLVRHLAVYATHLEGLVISAVTLDKSIAEGLSMLMGRLKYLKVCFRCATGQTITWLSNVLRQGSGLEELSVCMEVPVLSHADVWESLASHTRLSTLRISSRMTALLWVVLEDYLGKTLKGVRRIVIEGPQPDPTSRVREVQNRIRKLVRLD